jgi:hypothetical protein
MDIDETGSEHRPESRSDADGDAHIHFVQSE